MFFVNTRGDSAGGAGGSDPTGVCGSAIPAEDVGRFRASGAGCFWHTPARGDFALRREALLARPKRAEKAA